MQACVELPSGPLIEYSAFCKAIAEAVCPVRVDGLKGIECVVGKVVKHQAAIGSATGTLDRTLRAGFQTVLLSDDGRTLEQLRADQDNRAEAAAPELPLGKQVVEFSLPYLLDESDRRALEAVLPQLPPLSYPMSVRTAAAFLDAYYDLAERPTWEPILMMAADIERHKGEQARVMERHQRELREAFSAGQVIAVDHHHVRAKELISGTFIPREDAIAYLRGHRLAWTDRDADTLVVHRKESAQPESKATLATMPPKLDAVGIGGTPTKAVPPAPGVQGNPIDAVQAAGDASRVSPPQINATSKRVGKVVRLPEVEALTGLSRSSIYNRMDERSPHYDPTFPRQFPLGQTVGSAVGWDAAEIEAWVAAQTERAAQPRLRGRKRQSS